MDQAPERPTRPDDGPPADDGDGTTPLVRMVEVPGGRLWTGTWGAGAGTPLVVVHGGPGMPSHYLEPLTALAGSRPVVLYDQLGCGRSDRPDDPDLWTVQRSVAELEAVLTTVRQALGRDRVHVLGHSWGAFLALAHAVERAPDSASDGRDAVASLVLSSPLVSVAAWTTNARALLARLPEPVRRAIARHERDGSYDAPAYLEATAAFNRRFFCTLDPWPPELQRTFAELGDGPYRGMWGPSEFTQTGTLRGADLVPSLEALRVPSLWVCGTEDEVAPAQLTAFAARASGRAEVVEGGSHCLHLEQTAHYLELVEAFLSEVDEG